jgi:hypothetical protein
MKIENLRSENNRNLARVAATVIWEDCDRPTKEIYFETTEAFAHGLSLNPHAFLVACIMPAMHHGEERVFINAEICPELRNGLITAMSWVNHWYEPGRQIVQIEAKKMTHLPTPRTPQRAASFFSGGIDSLATLRANRLNFPLEHPSSIKDGLFICWPGYKLDSEQSESFDPVRRSLSQVAQDADISLIPVRTNIGQLDKDLDFLEKAFYGAILSAIAHSFSRRFTAVNIASSLDIYNLYPYGTHPILDPNYSSSELRIIHDSIVLSRFAKTKIVADWDVGLQNIRVCDNKEFIKPGGLNCGQCEKCLRTMTGLLALGVLDKTRAFPEVDVSEELFIAKTYIKNPPCVLSYYRELIAPLAAQGRHDLVRGIQRLIARYYMKERLGAIDHKFFKGKLLNFYKSSFKASASA